MDPLTIALLVLLVILVGIIFMYATNQIRRLDEKADKMLDIRRRMDEINVVIGEGFMPQPDLPNADLEGEADIQRQIDEMRRGVRCEALSPAIYDMTAVCHGLSDDEMKEAGYIRG